MYYLHFQFIEISHFKNSYSWIVFSASITLYSNIYTVDNGIMLLCNFTLYYHYLKKYAQGTDNFIMF